MLRCSKNVQTRQFFFQKVHPKVAFLLCPGATDQSGSPAGCFQPRHSWKDSFGATLIKVAREKRRACPLESGSRESQPAWYMNYSLNDFLGMEFRSRNGWISGHGPQYPFPIFSYPLSTWHRLAGDGSTVVPWLVCIGLWRFASTQSCIVTSWVSAYIISGYVFL